MARSKVTALAGCIAILGLVLTGAISQTAGAASVEEIALMNRADRQTILLEGAKKEGKISWYTTLIVDQVASGLREADQLERRRGALERLPR